MISKFHVNCRAAALTVALVGLALAAGAAQAQQLTDAQKSAMRANCRSDFMANCMSTSPGSKEALECLQNNLPKLSPGCQAAVKATMPPPSRGSASARAASAATRGRRAASPARCAAAGGRGPTPARRAAARGRRRTAAAQSCAQGYAQGRATETSQDHRAEARRCSAATAGNGAAAARAGLFARQG